MGPFERSEVPEVHLSRFGVIPKSNQLGKWRLIVDLSHPEGRSVNDAISGELRSLQYMHIEEVVRRLLKPRGTDGKDGHKKCVSDGTCASTGLSFVGCAVGGAGVC